MVVGDLAIEILVGLHKLLPHKTDVDTAHRAAGARRVAQQRLVGKGFTGDARDVRIGGLLKVLDGQRLEFVENGHVNRGAQVVIFVHHVGGGELLVHFLEEIGILFALGESECAITLNRNRLEIFASHNRATSEPAEVTVGIHSYAGIGGEVFSCRPDTQDGPMTGAANHFAKHLSGSLQVNSPHIVNIIELKMARSN